MSEKFEEILLQNCPKCGDPYYLGARFNTTTKMLIDWVGYCKKCGKIVSVTKEEE